jgi:hypothetical protein
VNHRQRDANRALYLVGTKTREMPVKLLLDQAVGVEKAGMDLLGAHLV